MRTAEYQEEKGKIALRWDEEGIRWLEDNVKGSPVILEANTPLYRWGSRISVYTGLPTVVGWDWHQKQQRSGYAISVDNRLRDVTSIYTGTDPAAKMKLLRKYNVRYVYLGQVEQMYYKGQGLAKFDAMIGKGLELAYENPKVKIYEVKG